jgi:signal transduction histidine kinase
MAMRAISLRTQILLLFLILAIIMAAILSLQSARNLLKAFDFHETDIMRRLADETLLTDGAAVEFLGFHIAGNWRDVPDNIREHFPVEPEHHGLLYSHFENWIFFAPPKNHYLLLKTTNHLGETRFVSKHRLNKDLQPVLIQDGEIRVDPMVEITLWGIGVTIIFVLAVLLALRLLARPVEALYQWAKQLNLDALDQPIPTFKFRELNSLAEIVHSSVTSVGASLQKEREFLRYASHELRTPISILCSNSAFLDKVSPTPSRKEREIRNRIKRASLTMKGITEVLLWLGREEDYPVPYEEVDLSGFLSQIVVEQQFLVEGKEIDLAMKLESYTQFLPKEALRMLLTNLIRNAFQHTDSGSINVTQQENKVVIENPIDAGSFPNAGANEIGFGLGLKLSRKLADRFDWELRSFQRQGLNVVEMRFNDHITNPARADS